MKGDIGICLFFDDGEMINKTKFKTDEFCQERIDTLIRLEVIDDDQIPYKCKNCNTWHMGHIDHIEKFSK